MIKTQGYAAQSATFPLKPWEFERREPASHDIHLEILYCGICHSDIHRARNEWLDTRYPIVPGHEIVGRVVEIGDKVTKFKIGDRAAVGAMVGSCLKCDACKAGLEQFCKNGFIETFNTFDKNTGSVTYGGYATNIVVSEQFTLHIPDAFKDQDLPGIAPLLCAGITTYSPLKYWNIGADKKVGIVGIGGLGHVAVKLAHALGANVTAITTTPSKESDATRLGATTSILSTDASAMKQHRNSFDFILNTIPAAHDLVPYLDLLTLDGTMCLVGIPPQPHPAFHAHSLIAGRKSLAGSLIGGIEQTQEMLNFCAEHGITADVEVVPPHMVNDAFEKVVNKDVRYRFVLDMKKI